MSDPRFTSASRVLADATARLVFPAAVAEVGTSSGVLWREAVGRLHEGDDAPLAVPETIFDLASLTKPIVTTTLTMRLADQRRLCLDDRVSRWLPAWRGTDRDSVTLRDLLEHASGLTAHLPFYRDCHGRVEFEQAICATALEYAPRTQSIYSDLGFILLGFILADAGAGPLDEQFADVRAALGLPELSFRPPREWLGRTAPTGLDAWRGRVLRGEVHDRNAWALSGVAGHAGLFGTAPAVGAFARGMLLAWHGATGGASTLARPETIRACAVRSQVPGSSRTLGWDGMKPTSSCGSLMHPASIGHTGYTGTSLWIDVVGDLYVVLLSNRVHPDDRDQSILEVRPEFHNAVIEALEGPR